MAWLTKLIDQKEMRVYLIVGACITSADWMTFTLVSKLFNAHYEVALLFGFAVGTILHYVFNKLITFKCESTQIGFQLSIYAMVVGCSLAGNMIIIALLINLFDFTQIVARILTTALMVIPNYLLHKHISYSKKIFVVASRPL